MPRRAPYDPATMDALVRQHERVVPRSLLLAAGLPESTLTGLTGPRGRWQRILPGVVLAHRGTPTVLERRRAALVYAGPTARIGGLHALDLHRALRDILPVDAPVFVVIPDGVHRTSSSFCVVERSERDPGEQVRRGFPVTSVARACADATRGHGMSSDDVRELMSQMLREDHCTLRDLQREVLSGPTQRSASARASLVELRAGARSAAEAFAYRTVVASDLPQPLWNQTVVIEGRWVGEADAWWPELGVVLEIDSMEWHLGAKALRRTQDAGEGEALRGCRPRPGHHRSSGPAPGPTGVPRPAPPDARDGRQTSRRVTAGDAASPSAPTASCR